MNYYKRHLGDYARKAGHLSMLEHGAYNLILDAYYDREVAPTRAEAMRYARARSQPEIAAVETVLAEFFVEQDGRFYQSRVEREFDEAAVQAEKSRENGKRGGRPRKSAPTTSQEPRKTQPVFSGNPDGTQKNLNPLIHKSTNPEEAKASAPAGGSRLPKDWTLPADWLAWAQAERPEIDAANEADKFRDYWHGVAGAKGRKADWQATWRNWIRNSRGTPRVTTPTTGKPSAAADFRGKSYDGTAIDDLPADLRAAALAAIGGNG